VKRLPVVILVVAVIVSVLAPPIAAQDLRSIAAIHARLMADGIKELERQNGMMREAWVLVESGTGAMVEAQRQGADLEALRVRDEQLQQLESQLTMRLTEVQRVRREVLANLAVIEAVGGISSSQAGQPGVLDGTWKLNVQPGLTGTLFLVQQGTLVSGTYELSGGWAGSVRGTLVANKIRLERIDSQLGFAAIFYGELDLSADPAVIQGRWEATQLAAGMPSAGGWRALRAD